MTTTPGDESWRGKRVSDMTDDEIRVMCGATSDDTAVANLREARKVGLDAATRLLAGVDLNDDTDPGDVGATSIRDLEQIAVGMAERFAEWGE